MKIFLIFLLGFFGLCSVQLYVQNKALREAMDMNKYEEYKAKNNSDYESGLRQGYMKGCLRGIERACWFNDCAVISLTEIKTKSCFGKEVN